MVRVYISVGSNVDRERHLLSAFEALGALGGIDVSPVYESEAVGFEGDPFYNCVVALETSLPLGELARRLRGIEADNGRVRGGPKFSSRTLDLDILTYGEQVGEFDGISLPRDEIARYAFVLKPLADIAPDALLPPSGPSYAELWRAQMASQPKMTAVSLRRALD